MQKSLATSLRLTVKKALALLASWRPNAVSAHERREGGGARGRQDGEGSAGEGVAAGLAAGDFTGVELFVRGDEVWFSEVSPRPHDTGLVTLASQAQSEFELMPGHPGAAGGYADAAAGGERGDLWRHGAAQHRIRRLAAGAHRATRRRGNPGAPVTVARTAGTAADEVVLGWSSSGHVRPLGVEEKLAVGSLRWPPLPVKGV